MLETQKCSHLHLIESRSSRSGHRRSAGNQYHCLRHFEAPCLDRRIRTQARRYKSHRSSGTHGDFLCMYIVSHRLRQTRSSSTEDSSAGRLGSGKSLLDTKDMLTRSKRSSWADTSHWGMEPRERCRSDSSDLEDKGIHCLLRLTWVDLIVLPPGTRILPGTLHTPFDWGQHRKSQEDTVHMRHRDESTHRGVESRDRYTQRDMPWEGPSLGGSKILAGTRLAMQLLVGNRNHQHKLLETSNCSCSRSPRDKGVPRLRREGSTFGSHKQRARPFRPRSRSHRCKPHSLRQFFLH